MAEPNYLWAGAIPLTQAAPTQRILAIAEDPATLERIAAAIQAGGATPVLVRNLKMLESAPDQLPFRFAVYAWDGSEAGLKLVTSQDARRRAARRRHAAVEPRLAHAPARRSALQPRAHRRRPRLRHRRHDRPEVRDRRPLRHREVPAEGHRRALRACANTRAAPPRSTRCSPSPRRSACAARCAPRSARSCEELLMNALYDAPVDEHGNADVRRGRSQGAPRQAARRARSRSATPRPRTASRSSCAIASAASRRRRCCATSTSACTRRTRSIARPTAPASASISSPTPRRSSSLNVAPGMATEVVCTFDRKTRTRVLRALVACSSIRARRRGAASRVADGRVRPKRGRRACDGDAAVRAVPAGVASSPSAAWPRSTSRKTARRRRLREVRRAQGDPSQLRGGSRVRPDARRRGEDRGAAAARQHRADVRPRARRRAVLHRDGVHRRRRSLQAPAPRLRARHRLPVRGGRVHRRRGRRRALDYAHRKRDARGRPLGIVHRDVSPQNVLVSYDGEVKIVDFGIAKAAMRGAADRGRRHQGQVLLHVARAGLGRSDRRAHRHLLGGHRALRDDRRGRCSISRRISTSCSTMVRKADIAPPSTQRKGVPRAARGAS